VQPVNKYIVIAPYNESVENSIGLTLTGDEANAYRYRKAKVVKVGTEVKSINDGDEVLYDKSAGFSAMLENESRTVIQERDVVIVL
jgi:co-chaperonin GroES (HSP10)